MLYYFDLFGAAVFAISGVLQARRVKMDVFGALVLATVTAIGGGTIRDMALGIVPVFWVRNSVYLLVILATCVLALLLLRDFPKVPRWLLPVADAIGLAVVTGIGVEKSLGLGSSAIVAVMMGVLTGVGGGIIRDVLSREIPMVMRTEIYATASIVGGIAHTGAVMLGVENGTAMLVNMAATLAIRLAAIRWRLELPSVWGKQD